jgi:hypothetical protein
MRSMSKNMVDGNSKRKEVEVLWAYNEAEATQILRKEVKQGIMPGAHRIGQPET